MPFQICVRKPQLAFPDKTCKYIRVVDFDLLQSGRAWPLLIETRDHQAK